MTTREAFEADIAAIRHTLMTGLAHNPAIVALDRIALSASQGREELLEALTKAHAQIQEFKTRWMALPPFADKLNRATREGMTVAHMPIMQAEETLRALIAKEQGAKK